MNDGFDDVGKLLLRLLIGGLLILHGIDKIMTGPGGIVSMIEANGLPGFLAWAVYLGEILGPILILIGYQARIGGVLVFLNMVVATLLLVSLGTPVWVLNQHGGWVMELEALYGLGGLVIALVGPGRFGIGGKKSEPHPEY